MTDAPVTPIHPKPAPVTTGRAIRLRRLFRECGLIQSAEAAEAAAPPAVRPGTPRRLADMPAQEALDAGQMLVEIDLGRVERVLWDEERILDALAILYGVSVQEAEELPPGALAEAIVPFVAAWPSTSATLAGCAASWV